MEFASKVRWLPYIIPLLCIFSRETAKLCFIFKLRNLGVEGSISTAILMFLAMFFSMILGLRSDKDCRRRMLIFTLLGSITSIGILNFAVSVSQNTIVSFFLYFGALVVDGVLGSAGTPIGRAAYFDAWDLNNNNNRKKNRIATDTIIASALPWIVFCLNLSFLEKLLTKSSLFISSIALLLVVFCFRDLRDKDDKLVSHEMNHALKKYLKGYGLRLMIAFLFYDLAFQFFNYLAIEFHSINEIRQDFLLVEGSGILLGSLISRIGFTYTKIFNSTYRIIFIFSLALFVVFFIPWIKGMIAGEFVIGNFVRFMFSFIGGIILSLSFGYFANRVTPHETGLLFGIMESIEIFAEGVISLAFFLGNLSYIANNVHFTILGMLVLIGIGVVLLSNKEKNSLIDR